MNDEFEPIQVNEEVEPMELTKETETRVQSEEIIPRGSNEEVGQRSLNNAGTTTLKIENSSLVCSLTLQEEMRLAKISFHTTPV